MPMHRQIKRIGIGIIEILEEPLEVVETFLENVCEFFTEVIFPTTLILSLIYIVSIAVICAAQADTELQRFSSFDAYERYLEMGNPFIEALWFTLGCPVVFICSCLLVRCMGDVSSPE